MSDIDSESEQFDDQIKDPTYKSKTTDVEVTDRSTRQGQSGSNLAKTATKAVLATGSKASGSKASVAKVVTVSSLADMPGEDTR